MAVHLANEEDDSLPPLLPTVQAVSMWNGFNPEEQE